MEFLNTAPPNWTSTLAFRAFRRKLESLSSVYWTFQLGETALRSALDGKVVTAKAVTELGSPFCLRMLPESVEELRGQLKHRSGVHRLHLLVVALANIESYLKDAVLLHVGGLGYAAGHRKLNDVGAALAAPIAKKSTVPEMVEYAGHLLSVDFRPVMASLKRAYKLRCEAVHSGGVVTARTLTDIPDLGVRLGDHIRLTWEQLLKYLKMLDRVASRVDCATAKLDARRVEVEWLLLDLKQRKALPPRPNVWHWLAQTYGVQGMPRSVTQKIERAVYV
jgi:hypothetical protein